MAKFYFYYSTMNAGKSTTLLQSAYNYHERGMKTLLFTPSLDSRYQPGEITSRIGLKASAISFNNDMNLFSIVAEQIAANHEPFSCILVDEAQFLTKEHVEQLSDIADKLFIPVLCYGLRTDFRGEPFAGSKYLLSWADELIEIKTICHCGKKATMNMRVDENMRPVCSGEQIEIGGNERYVATCRKHYKQGIAKTSKDTIPEAKLDHK